MGYSPTYIGRILSSGPREQWGSREIAAQNTALDWATEFANADYPDAQCYHRFNLAHCLLLAINAIGGGWRNPKERDR